MPRDTYIERDSRGRRRAVRYNDSGVGGLGSRSTNSTDDRQFHRPQARRSENQGHPRRGAHPDLPNDLIDEVLEATEAQRRDVRTLQDALRAAEDIIEALRAEKVVRDEELRESNVEKRRYRRERDQLHDDLHTLREEHQTLLRRQPPKVHTREAASGGPQIPPPPSRRERSRERVRPDGHPEQRRAGAPNVQAHGGRPRRQDWRELPVPLFFDGNRAPPAVPPAPASPPQARPYKAHVHFDGDIHPPHHL